MSMERSSKGLIAIGDHDLAGQLAGIQQEFARRHPGMNDIPLIGRLPGETSRLDPSLEGKIRTVKLTIGGKIAQELLAELIARKGNVGSYAKSMVESSEFTTLPEPTQIELAIIEARNLKPGTSYPTTEQIYGCAAEKGLDLLPAEAFLYHLIQNGDQMEPGERLVAGMKPIADSGGGPRVFYIEHLGRGLWLDGRWAGSSSEWYPSRRFAFMHRK